MAGTASMKKSPSNWIQENLPWIERVIAVALVAATIILLAAAARRGFWPTPETVPYTYLSDRLRIVAIVFLVL